MFWICRHFENQAPPTKPSSKERVMKISKCFQPAKCGMHKSIKLNYFEHINILESCNQPGIDNKSSNFIPEMVSCLEIKIQGGFFCKKIQGLISIHCKVSENKRYVNIT